MSQFVGSYSHSLDAKKRVFIPAKYREELGDTFYITRKFDVYLSVYTADEWEAYTEKLEKLPESVAGDIQDFILGGAQKCTPDSNGRIIIEDRLLKHAKITKNIVFVGSGRTIKIWAEENWEDREENRDFTAIRETMKEFGL